MSTMAKSMRFRCATARNAERRKAPSSLLSPRSSVAVAPIEAAKFKLTRGQEFMKEFRATAGKARVFSSECASPLYSARDDLPSIKRLRLGTLDTNVCASKRYHAFVSSKANWHEITDGHPQHQGVPDRRG